VLKTQASYHFRDGIGTGKKLDGNKMFLIETVLDQTENKYNDKAQ
jgi:hypothetical protein